MDAKVSIKYEKYKPEVIKKMYELLHEELGLINKVAIESGYHRETVRLTLIGKRKKSLDKVMQAGAKVLAAHNSRYKETMRAIHKATSY